MYSHLAAEPPLPPAKVEVVSEVEVLFRVPALPAEPALPFLAIPPFTLALSALVDAAPPAPPEPAATLLTELP